MYIDCHTHCRDEKASYKGETIEHALRVAEDSGLSGIFDMHNIPDPITTRKRVLERITLAEAVNSDVFFGIYVGITPNLKQVGEAVRCYKEFFPKSEDKVGVIGLKMFAEKSNTEEQLKIYKKLAKLGYDGVLDVHCEKESEMHPELWDPSRPISHCDTRPENSEIASVKDQIKFAQENEFAGNLHIVHVSTPQSVEIINAVKNYMRISCGVCPHHLLLSREIMSQRGGVMYKMNPPLRDFSLRERLFKKFLEGEIDILESDHAPHSFEEKTEKYLSGIPNLASWPDFIDILKAKGVSQELLDKVAFENVNRIFRTDIKRINKPLKNHVQDYVFDPYGNLK